jgi:hypothetical protein
MNKNQRGFSVVEGLLILVIVGTIGFIGWYVWKSKNKTDSIYNHVNNNQTVLPSKPVTPPLGLDLSKVDPNSDAVVISHPNYTLHDGNLREYYAVTTKGLQDLIKQKNLTKQCAPGVISLSRFTKDPFITGMLDSSYTDSTKLRHVGDYYYIWSYAQIPPCSDPDVISMFKSANDTLLADLDAYYK